MTTTWPGPISAITIFVDDLPAALEFYDRAFGLPRHWQDENSAVYDLGNTLINVLVSTEAPELIEPRPVASESAGSRVQFTLSVDDVDATAADLAGRGVALLNGPVNRSWGIRTAAFADPAGHVWEIAGPLAGE